MKGLQPANAFVVQFRGGVDTTSGTLSGRVEHVTTGSTAIFQSVDDLPTIIRRMLKDLREQQQSQEQSAD